MRRIWRQHGGAGWTRTSDNAIMSRALYRLSYGTAGKDPIAPPVPAPSACASLRGACAAPPASFYSRPLQKITEPDKARLRGCCLIVAEVGFEPTTFGL